MRRGEEKENLKRRKCQSENQNRSSLADTAQNVCGNTKEITRAKRGNTENGGKKDRLREEKKGTRVCLCVCCLCVLVCLCASVCLCMEERRQKREKETERESEKVGRGRERRTEKGANASMHRQLQQRTAECWAHKLLLNIG